MGFDFIIGVVVGTLTYMVIHLIITFAITTYGTLRIDHSNPDKDTYRIEIDNLDQLSKKKRVELKIDNHANLSQK